MEYTCYYAITIYRRNSGWLFLTNGVVFFVVVDLCTTAGVRKVAAELGKVKEMYTRIYVLVEKDSEKKSDPSKWVSLMLYSKKWRYFNLANWKILSILIWWGLNMT